MQLCSPMSKSFLAAAALLTTVGFGAPRASWGEDRSAFCEQILTMAKVVDPSGTGELDADEEAVQVLNETYTLKEYLDVSPQGFAANHPTTAMSAAQKILGMILAEGYEDREIPWLPGGPVRIYNFFSKGTSATKFRRIVGQERAIEDFMQGLVSQAHADRNGMKVPAFVGGAGTGKTEIQELIALGIAHKTRTDSKYYAYTYRWKNLPDIPELYYLHNTIQEGENTIEIHRTAAMNQSPLVMLPGEVQNQLIEAATPSALKMTQGIAPDPVLESDPQSLEIRDQILAHYLKMIQAKNKNAVLDVATQIEILNRHLEVVRFTISEKKGTLPIIDAQPNDVDVGGLFMNKNMLNFTLLGSKHPFSYNFDGQAVRGEGYMTLWDEFLRNPDQVLRVMMGILQSRRISIGGSLNLPFDSMMAVATNKANWDEKEADPKLIAQLDRLNFIRMPWSRIPQEVSKVMAYMVQKNIWMRPLTDKAGEDTATVADANWQHGNLDELYPLPRRGEKVKTPDGRYEMRLYEGERAITIAPLALKMMGMIVAATRMETDPNKATKANPTMGKIASSPEYRDYVSRIRFFEGSGDMNAATLRDLTEITDLLLEGESGIGARDAGAWLQTAAQLAEKSVNNRTITPRVVILSFKQALIQKKIKTTPKEHMHYLQIADRVAQELIVPLLEADLATAIAYQDNNVEAGYWDLIQEFEALKDDPTADTYENGHGDMRTIDHNKINFLKQYYLKTFRRQLAMDQIAMWHKMAMQQKPEGFKDKPNPELMQALAAWFTRSAGTLINLEKVEAAMKNERGDPETVDTARSIVRNMGKLGYNRQATIDAINWVQQSKNPRQRVQ